MTIQAHDHAAGDPSVQAGRAHTVTGPVIVVGAGPVGLVAAIDLAWRGNQPPEDCAERIDRLRGAALN